MTYKWEILQSYLFHCQIRLVASIVAKAAGCWVTVGGSQPRGRSGGQQREGTRLVHVSSPVRESWRQRCQAALREYHESHQRNYNVEHGIKLRALTQLWATCLYFRIDGGGELWKQLFPPLSFALMTGLPVGKKTQLAIDRNRTMVRRKATLNRSHDHCHLLMLHSVLVRQEVWSSSIPIRVMGWMKRTHGNISANLMTTTKLHLSLFFWQGNKS